MYYCINNELNIRYHSELRNINSLKLKQIITIQTFFWKVIGLQGFYKIKFPFHMAECTAAVVTALLVIIARSNGSLYRLTGTIHGRISKSFTTQNHSQFPYLTHLSWVYHAWSSYITMFPPSSWSSNSKFNKTINKPKLILKIKFVIFMYSYLPLIGYSI